MNVSSKRASLNTVTKDSQKSDCYKKCMQILERYWLRSSDFVAGEEISIADLLMVTELDMLHMLAGSDEVTFYIAISRIIFPELKRPTMLGSFCCPKSRHRLLIVCVWRLHFRPQSCWNIASHVHSFN